MHELWVSIAVVDDTTYEQHPVRMAGAPYTSADGAIEKARTAADGGHPTPRSPVFDEPLNVGRYSMLKMPHIYQVEGGIPVIVDGQWVGAIGVASVLPHLDAAVADAGRKALDRSDLAMAPTGRLTGVSYSKDLRG